MTQLVETELQRLLRLSEGSYVQAFEKLKAEVQEDQKPPRTTVAQREEEWKKALASQDETKLLEMQETMSNYVDLVSKHEIKFDELPKELTKDDRVRLMKEHTMFKDMDEFLKIRREWIRSVIFEIITEMNRKKGVEDPEHATGSVEVPELGKRFAKNGGGRKDPILDEEKLKTLLGAQWADACEVEFVPRQVIEEHTELRFSIEKVMKLAENDLTVLEKVRESLTPGDWKSNSFAVYNL